MSLMNVSSLVVDADMTIGMQENETKKDSVTYKFLPKEFGFYSENTGNCLRVLKKE